MSERLADLPVGLFQLYLGHEHWIKMSDQLWHSAIVLWDNHRRTARAADFQCSDPFDKLDRSLGTGRTALMLTGLSMENLLKGLLILDKTNSDGGCFSISEDDYEYVTKKSHDLSNLWKQGCKIVKYEILLNDVEKIDRISNFVSWVGRYPAPKKESHFDDYLKKRKNGAEGRFYEIETLFDWAAQNRPIMYYKLKQLEVIFFPFSGANSAQD